ncbi:DUF4410 domain-containing protein [Burkholderia sp. WAC0059]|uniref:DUF4410 domain-containing protein n=1 Tax=Burkholderia sp. WAC0059 TaxID=2066022 RepID=UPI0015E0F56D|nr:DUF4410 domain-containing protein [Burkholderia sp. WAC0059]
MENDSPAPKKVSRRKRQLADAQMASAALSQSISKLLASRQISAVSAGRPADLILRCRILDVRSGSKALRALVGYGAGKAVLRVSVSLYEPGAEGSTPLLSFETDGSTGSMPGAGFTAPALVGDGLSALKKDGLPKEVDQTTASIDQVLAKYFAARNWPYPKPDESGVGPWLNRNVLNR